MNEKEFNGLILAELVKIANEVFTNEIEIAPATVYPLIKPLSLSVCSAA